MCYVNVAVLVHLYNLDLHARHLGAGWVGAMGRLGDQTNLTNAEHEEYSLSTIIVSSHSCGLSWSRRVVARHHRQRTGVELAYLQVIDRFDTLLGRCVPGSIATQGHRGKTCVSTLGHVYITSTLNSDLFPKS